MKASEDIKKKIFVVAKAFYDDGVYDDDYEFTDVNQQYDEMLKEYESGELTESFINAIYKMNS